MARKVKRDFEERKAYMRFMYHAKYKRKRAKWDRYHPELLKTPRKPIA